MNNNPYHMSYEERLNALQLEAMHDLLIFPHIQRVFAYLCDAATDYHDAANVQPVKMIAQFTGLSKYYVRIAIKALVRLGLVERTTCGFPWRPPVNGFGLTEKGYETKTYKKASEMMDEYYRRACEEVEV